MTEEQEKSFGDKVKEAITQESANTVVPISFPAKSYRRFRKWAAENASNCYWLAIDKLIDYHEMKLDLGHEFRMLADRDEILLSEIVRLEEELEKLKETPQPVKRRGFGRKEEEGKENE